MTPLQIAYAHCANYLKDTRGCLGAIIDDDLQIRRCVPRPKCVLGTPGQRCPYFEECVMPMGPRIHDPKYRRSFMEGLHLYRMPIKTPIPITPTRKRTCPTCNGPIPKRHRLCQNCASTKRRETRRTSEAKRRGLTGQLTEKMTVHNQ